MYTILNFIYSNQLYLWIPLFIFSLMFISLVVALSVKENGKVVIRKDSFFFVMRSILQIPYTSFSGIPKDSWNEEHGYLTRIWKKAKENATSRTSLCGLFWDNFFSFFIVLPVAVLFFTLVGALVISFGPVLLLCFGVFKIVVLFGMLVFAALKKIWTEGQDFVTSIDEYFEKLEAKRFEKVKSQIKSRDDKRYQYELKRIVNDTYREAKREENIGWIKRMFNLILEKKSGVSTVLEEKVSELDKKFEFKLQKGQSWIDESGVVPIIKEYEGKIEAYEKKKERRRKEAEERRQAFKRKLAILKDAYKGYLCPTISYQD